MTGLCLVIIMISYSVSLVYFVMMINCEAPLVSWIRGDSKDLAKAKPLLIGQVNKSLFLIEVHAATVDNF